MRRQSAAFLLSLIPPSCIVAPNRDLGNKHLLTSAFISSSVQMANLPPDVAMDVDNVNNFDDVRGRSSSFSKVSSRSASMSSSASSVPYSERMAANNNLLDNDKEPIDSSQLSYKDNSQERDCVSKAADLIPP